MSAPNDVTRLQSSARGGEVERLREAEDRDLKDAVCELLSHRGEQPYRVLRGGQELWETWLPAFRAALRYLPTLASPPASNAAADGAREKGEAK